MKVRSLLVGMLCMLALSVSFASCSDDDDDFWMIQVRRLLCRKCVLFL